MQGGEIALARDGIRGRELGDGGFRVALHYSGGLLHEARDVFVAADHAVQWAAAGERFMRIGILYLSARGILSRLIGGPDTEAGWDKTAYDPTVLISP